MAIIEVAEAKEVEAEDEVAEAEEVEAAAEATTNSTNETLQQLAQSKYQTTLVLYHRLPLQLPLSPKEQFLVIQMPPRDLVDQEMDRDLELGATTTDSFPCSKYLCHHSTSATEGVAYVQLDLLHGKTR